MNNNNSVDWSRGGWVQSISPERQRLVEEANELERRAFARWGSYEERPREVRQNRQVNWFSDFDIIPQQQEQQQEVDDEEDEEYDDEKNCSICMRRYNNSERQRYTITSCQKEHPLCRTCAITVVSKSRNEGRTPTCPMCRASFRGIENQGNKTFSFSDNKKYRKSRKSKKTSSQRSRKRTSRKLRSYKKRKISKTRSYKTRKHSR